MPFMFMTWFSPRVQYCESTQDHSVPDPIFQCRKIQSRRYEMFISSSSGLSSTWLFSHASNIMKVHYVSWKYKMSVYLWLNIPFMKDPAPSICYTMFISSSLCLSCSRLDFSAGSNVMKVHKVSVFMTQYSKAERLRSINKLQNVSIFQFVFFFMFTTLFSHESNIMKVHKFTLSVDWYSMLKDWASSRT